MSFVFVMCSYVYVCMCVCGVHACVCLCLHLHASVCACMRVCLSVYFWDCVSQTLAMCIIEDLNIWNLLRSSGVRLRSCILSTGQVVMALLTTLTGSSTRPSMSWSLFILVLVDEPLPFFTLYSLSWRVEPVTCYAIAG